MVYLNGLAQQKYSTIINRNMQAFFQIFSAKSVIISVICLALFYLPLFRKSTPLRNSLSKQRAHGFLWLAAHGLSELANRIVFEEEKDLRRLLGAMFFSVE